MEKVTIKFEFKIGDEVIFKGTDGVKVRKMFGRKLKPEEEVTLPAQVFRVTDRFYEECYGGVQLHYMLRPLGKGRGNEAKDTYSYIAVGDILKAREIELEIA